MMLAMVAVLMTNVPVGAVASVSVDAASVSPEALLQHSRAALAKLGVYRLRFTKEERLEDGWIGPQVMDLVVRERPFAVRATIIAGPNKGRRFLYDTTSNKEQLLLREAGLLGMLPLWIDIDSRLTRGDTRHGANELGFGFILATIERDHRLAQGRFMFTDEGLDKAGARCLMLTPPPAVPGIYALRTRVCFAPSSLAMTRVEVWDQRGLAERFAFQVVEANMSDSGLFTLDDAPVASR